MTWRGAEFVVRLGNPAHGGFMVARHEGRVVFVRHGLPGEQVRVRVTQDRGGSFCHADVVAVEQASADRVEQACPVAGPGGAGCCDFSHAALPAQRELKAQVVSEQLRRIAGIDRDVEVVALPGNSSGSGWRTRLRLAVGLDGSAGVRGYHDDRVIADLRCPQPVPGALAGLDNYSGRPGSEIAIAFDGEGRQHVVELAPIPARPGGGRRAAASRRSAAAKARGQRLIAGTGRAREQVSGRWWNLDATGFWQAHQAAAQTYANVVADWAQVSAGDTAWDLYSGAGVFAAELASLTGPGGQVAALESSPGAVRDGRAALADLPQVSFWTGRTEQQLAALPGNPVTVVADPPRAGAGKQVIPALADRRPANIIHIGCDPASFARDVGLYARHGYRLVQLRAYDAFPLTHHVECAGLLVPDRVNAGA